MDHAHAHPVTYDVAYPDRRLNRLTSFFRLVTAVPVVLLFTALAGVAVVTEGAGTGTVVATGSGLLFLPPLLMLVFRGRYPRWWYDFNVELLRFQNRVGVYVALMDDRYPSTEDRQSVRLDLPEPVGLSRWKPLVKWALAIPHYLALAVLVAGAAVGVLVAWFAILFTGRYPRAIFDYLVGVGRWSNRVTAYAFLLVTDDYPPFRLAA